MWKLRTLDWLLAPNGHLLVVVQMVLFWNMESQLAVFKIKWPFSKKDKMLADAAKGDKAFFLKLTHRGLELKRNSLYYYQCQGVVNL